MRISDWSSDVCSSDLRQPRLVAGLQGKQQRRAVQCLGLAERHAHQRAVGADGELEHVALDPVGLGEIAMRARRSEEHTSELQSLMRTSYAVFCLKKKNRALRVTNSDGNTVKLKHSNINQSKLPDN